jgi:hypothetical protein
VRLRHDPPAAACQVRSGKLARAFGDPDLPLRAGVGNELREIRAPIHIVNGQMATTPAPVCITGLPLTLKKERTGDTRLAKAAVRSVLRCSVETIWRDQDCVWLANHFVSRIAKKSLCRHVRITPLTLLLKASSCLSEGIFAIFRWP